MRRKAPTGILRVAVFLLMSAGLLCCGGCLVNIRRVLSSPSATGVVLDAETGQPVAGAQVAVSRYLYPPGPEKSLDDPITISNALHFVRRPRVKTTETGSFSIPARHKLIAILPLCDYFDHAGGILTVKCPGYETKLMPVSELVPIEVATNGYGWKVLLRRSSETNQAR